MESIKKSTLNLQKSKRLSELSTFGIGGEAKFYLIVHSIVEMREAFQFAKKEGLPVFILGKGSNCLFDDRGFDGLVVHNKIDFFEVEGNRITAGAGYSFSLLGGKVSKLGLTGLEFAAGIPASVGGAVYMNAGANGQETKDTLVSVHYLTLAGEEKHFLKEEIQFSYRISSFQKMNGAILSATFECKQGEKARETQLALIDRRKKTQPLQDKSAGCVFRNPTEASAGYLIDACGLKGYRIGGAEVSPIHANFIVNTGNATSKDVLSLIQHIQNTIYAKKEVLLEMEIRYIPVK